jgi:hypothetical protein
MRPAIFAILAAGAVFTVAMEARASGDLPGLLRADLAAALWPLAPYALLAVSAALRLTGGRRIILLATAVLTVALGIGLYVWALILTNDAQSGLILIFAPIYQMAIVLLGMVALVVSAVVHRRRRPAAMLHPE